MFITIDPGWSGAVAFFEKGYLQFTTKCPASREPEDMVKVIRNVIARKKPKVYIERVWARPYERGAFTFGENYGIWLGIIASLKLERIDVLPKEWQAVVGNRIPKDYTERKRYFKRRAQKWAGRNHKITLLNADAVCIGMYVINKEEK
jgi:heterodisulfide reductase subunit C